MQIAKPDHLTDRSGVIMARSDQPEIAFYVADPVRDWTVEVYQIARGERFQSWSYVGDHTLSRPLRSNSPAAKQRARAGVTIQAQREAWATEALLAFGVPLPVPCHVLLERAKAGLP